MDKKFGVETADDILVFVPQIDYLDAANGDEFRNAIEEELQKGKSMVIDLASVRFVDSSGLGVLMAALKRARAQGNDLVACGVVKTVKQLFNLVRLDRVMSDYADRDTAIAALRGSRKAT